MERKVKFLIAEMIGTFFLVLMGCGAIVVNDLHGGVLGHTGVAMSFGLVVMIMIYSVGNISGAHLNPAVTTGFFISGRINRKEAAWYMIGQLAGAMAAALTLKMLFPEHGNLGSTLPGAGAVPSFFIEIVISALLMFVIFNVSTGHMEKGIMAGVAVGGTIALAALVAGPLTGASMNPFRSLAPAVMSGNIEGLWIYLFAPVAGACLAYPGYYFTGKPYCSDKES